MIVYTVVMVGQKSGVFNTDERGDKRGGNLIEHQNKTWLNYDFSIT